MDTTLEVLQRAAVTLRDPEVPFDFMDWGSCTCGHLYAAAQRREPAIGGDSSLTHALSPSFYGEVISDVAYTLGWDGDGNPASYVSTFTVTTARKAAAWPAWNYLVRRSAWHPASEKACVDRSSALEVVETAIRRIQAQEEEARLAVLESAREIVDAADLDPVELVPV